MTFTKKCPVSRILILGALTAAAAVAQTYKFDNSANGMLTGTYFVREVTLLQVNGAGVVGEAVSAIGIATFDGQGNYSFSGQFSDSTAQPVTVNKLSNGTYALAANGFLRIASFTSAAPAFGGAGAVGPWAFTASATENSGSTFDLIAGIPISTVTNASLKGAFNAVYLNFPQASIGQTRQASIAYTADGEGGLGTPTATGSASDNANLTTQKLSTATYSLAGTTGTMNFGSAAPDQLIGGTQSFFISTDGNLIVGGSPSGFDFLVASPAVSAPSLSTFQGFYFLSALEADNSLLAGNGESLLDAFYGSANSTGQGIYTSHLRLNTNGYSVEDVTSGWQSSVQANGSFTPGDGDQYWLGAGGQVVLALGLGNFYSLEVGIHAFPYKPNNAGDVFLNPLGIVNAASFAPPTNPVAPQEMVTLFGSNLSSGSAQATGYPLPTSILSTEVLVNGVAAPLLSVSPSQITLLVPSIATPDFTAYAAFEVENHGGVCAANTACPTSALVTMYTNYTAPGMFSASGDGMGPAAAEGAAYLSIGSANPAKPLDIPMLYLTGLGSVSPRLIDGVPASLTGDPFNISNIYSSGSLSVYFDGIASPNIQFAGAAPGLAGVYQINAQIPSGVAAGNDYLDIQTPDAEAQQVTLNITTARAGTVGPTGTSTRKRSHTARRATLFGLTVPLAR